MLHSMAGKERNATTFDRPDGHVGRRIAVRRIHVDVFDVVKERVEARASEDPDADRLAGGRFGAQADFSFALLAADLEPFFPDRSPFEPDPASAFEPDASPFEPDPASPVESDPASPFEPISLLDPAFSAAEGSLFSPSPEVFPLDRVLESVE
jgi:hypothetical protein